MSEVSGKSRKEPRPDDFRFPEYRAPELTSQRLSQIEKAAAAFAHRHASDPFAYDRILMHMKRGLAEPDHVLSDSRVASGS